MVFRRTSIVVLSIAFAFGLTAAFNQGASQTKGEPWPLPASYTPSSTTLYMNQFNFDFIVTGSDCTILRSAINRYFKLIFYPGAGGQRSKREVLIFKPTEGAEELVSLNVNVEKPCSEGEYPFHGMDESYQLTISGSHNELKSASVWGALRGLETFSQLIYKEQNGMDAMAWNKLNVFHWHIVDDQSFPYQSVLFPDLSAKGAFNPYTHVYTQEDIAEIIEYARMRGIRVVPEFDTPGHSQSWGPGQPGLLAECYDGGKPSGSYGPIDPTLNTTYPFLSKFMGEVSKVFPDKYIHLGGDEVSFDCWKSNPVIQKFMTAIGFGTDFAKLEAYYMQKLLDIVGSYGSGYLVWQEVIDNGVKVKPDTIAHVWKSSLDEVNLTTSQGLQTLYSTCWYLNYIAYGSDWSQYYKCDPQNFNGTQKQKDLVIGGELCMWGEYVDSTVVISRTWPRGSVVAERLWSPSSITDEGYAATRIEEHRCRMIRRGLNVEPINGPGHCVDEYVP